MQHLGTTVISHLNVQWSFLCQSQGTRNHGTQEDHRVFLNQIHARFIRRLMQTLVTASTSSKKQCARYRCLTKEACSGSLQIFHIFVHNGALQIVSKKSANPQALVDAVRQGILKNLMHIHPLEP